VKIGPYDFWPKGDDSYSRAARLNTVLAGVCSVSWILFALLCLAIARRILAC